MVHLTVEGNVANDPDLRYLPDGTAVCNLRVMFTKRFQDCATGEWKDGATTTLDVACWHQLAINVTEGIKIGDAVVVTAKDLVAERNEQYVNLKCSASTVAVSAKWYAASPPEWSTGTGHWTPNSTASP